MCPSQLNDGAITRITIRIVLNPVPTEDLCSTVILSPLDHSSQPLRFGEQAVKPRLCKLSPDLATAEPQAVPMLQSRTTMSGSEATPMPSAAGENIYVTAGLVREKLVSQKEDAVAAIVNPSVIEG